MIMSDNGMEFIKIIHAIKNSQNIVIAGHTSPDGDAIGASLALSMALKKIDKNVKVLFESYSEKYNIIPGKETVIFDDFKGITCDLFIAADCGDKQRLGNASTIFDKADVKVNIDHHASNTFFGEINLVREDSSSTSEIMYDIIKNISDIDDDIATALYTGLLFDTGGFRHSCTTSNTMAVASELLKFNVPATMLYDKLYYTRNFTGMKILGKAIGKAQKIYDGRVIYTDINLKDIEECGSSLNELDEIVNCLKSVEDTDLAIFFYEKAENVYKVSLRSSDNFNSCKLASFFGGGGHIKASGCTIEGNIEGIKKLVFEKIEDMI